VEGESDGKIGSADLCTRLSAPFGARAGLTIDTERAAPALKSGEFRFLYSEIKR
jgi:hypothetical protein